MAKKIEIYDTTLRDGIQREGISLSIEDKLRILKKLDELGIPVIEAGYPAANPKEAEFFRCLKDVKLKQARIAAFTATCRRGMPAFKDEGLNAAILSGAQIITVVGKASLEQVKKVLGTSAEENLRMVRESIEYVANSGRTVYFDAEHFFDGYMFDKEYTFDVLRTAVNAGATCLVLCETNGGCLPHDVKRIVAATRKEFSQVKLGIHAHDDAGCAVANSLLAATAGIDQIQGCINGYGERVGNANLSTIIPSLELKMDYKAIGEANLAQMTPVAQFVADTVNVSLDSHSPYVGSSAFAHKAGIHVSAVMREAESYNHVNPIRVGNFAHIIVSELAGRAALESKAAELGLGDKMDSRLSAKVLERIKELEAHGYSFEAADASLALIMADALGGRKEYFRLETFRVITERLINGTSNSEATIKIHVGNERFVATGEGNGPVNALDAALRKAIAEFYPQISNIELSDYKVRVLDETSGTDAGTRVLIESTDGQNAWGTVGVSENVIEASWDALVESIVYGLMLHEEE